jgi:hypothetical protein
VFLVKQIINNQNAICREQELEVTDNAEKKHCRCISLVDVLLKEKKYFRVKSMISNKQAFDCKNKDKENQQKKQDKKAGFGK